MKNDYCDTVEQKLRCADTEVFFCCGNLICERKEFIFNAYDRYSRFKNRSDVRGVLRCVVLYNGRAYQIRAATQR